VPLLLMNIAGQQNCKWQLLVPSCEEGQSHTVYSLLHAPVEFPDGNEIS